MPTEQKHYYAFVSHSSRDAKIALWLRDKLVNYNIPASIRKENQMPKRLRPVFIYQTDLAGANLQDALQRELEDSQWLIVICSPDGAKSQYVNGEVEHFINTGRANRIIPFIVGGTPHATNPEDECFPPALLKLAKDGIELRGVNLAECQKQLGSKMGAVVNVVATMLGVRFDSMWNVYQRKQRRQLFVAAVIAALFCFAGFFAWEYWHPRYEYFADYVDKWGVPEGIIPVSKEQFKHRHATWQFTYHRTPLNEPGAWKWRVTEVKHVNSAGRAIDLEETDRQRSRSAIQKLVYNKQTGCVAQQIYCDIYGDILLRHILSERDGKPACVADFLFAQEEKGQGYVSSFVSGFRRSEMGKDYIKSSIVRYVYERNGDGYIIKQTFHTSNDYNLSRSATPDAAGVFGFGFVLDSLGRYLQANYLDEQGNITCSRHNGIASERYEYDSLGGYTKIYYVDLSGNVIMQQFDRCATICYRYDKWGNRIETAYYDTEGNACLSFLGTKIVALYDDYGNRIEYVFWTKEEDSTIITKTTYKYDKFGNIIERSYWDKDGSPLAVNDASCKQTYKYDANGRLTEWAYWGVDGKRCLNAWGYSIQRNKYDACGRQTEWSFWGTDEKLCNNSDGFAIQVYVYDDRGNKIEEALYNADRELCYNEWNTYPKQTDKYDSRGNSIESTFWGTDGELIPDSLGCPRVTRKWDDQGNVIEWAFWDADGQPCSNTHGYARRENVYDEKGNEIETAYFGEDGQPCVVNGYSKMVRKYDEQSNELEKFHYGIDGNLCLQKGGYAIVSYEYDAMKNKTRVSFFGTDGKPCMINNGFAYRTSDYNEWGSEIERKFFDLNGQLCNQVNGYARWIAEYDNLGELATKHYYDKDGKEVQITE